MATTWWNAAYPFRRQLELIGTVAVAIPVNHPVFVTYAKADILDQNKTRSDFEDIEILYDSSEDATPNWEVLSRDITEDADNIYIVFNVIEEVSTTVDNYYVHMGNPNLSNQPVRPPYTDFRYLLQTTPTSGLGLSFVRPSEDWEGGVSDKINARSTFSFYGPSVRLVIEKSYSSGIVELTFDREAPIYIDAYALNTMEAVVFDRFDLPKMKHFIRLRITGDKNPASAGDFLKIISYEFSKFIDAIDMGEEIYAPNGSITILTGA